MTANEIQKLIKRRGTAAQQVFNAYLIRLNEERDKAKHKYKYTDDDIATFSYNCTISVLKHILNYPEFFEREFGVKESNRIRIRKDLEKMERIKYSDKETDDDLYFYERLEAETLPVDEIIY